MEIPHPKQALFGELGGEPAPGCFQLDRQFNGRDLPSIVAETMREVLKEQH